MSVGLCGVRSRHSKFEGCPVDLDQYVRSFGAVCSFLVNPFVKRAGFADQAHRHLDADIIPRGCRFHGDAFFA